jgi:gluconolactonase
MHGADSGKSEPVVYPPLDATQIGAPTMVATGFSLAEGPLWDHCNHVLLFSDVDNAVIHRLTPPSTVDVFRMNTNYANALAYDPQHRLVMAQMGPDTASGRIARVGASGMDEVIVDKGPMGIALHASDDLVILSDGTIYFTDPEFAHGPCSSLGCSDLLSQLPIYQVTPAGVITLQGMTTGPNGIDISPDEKTLYVNSYFGGQTLRFSIGAGGALTPGMPLAVGLTNPDSMCVDAGGNVYVGVSTGVAVFHPDGTPVTTIPMNVPPEPGGTNRYGVTNCGFGGDDGKTLYMSAWSDLWKVENMPIPGLDWVMNKDKPCN